MPVAVVGKADGSVAATTERKIRGGGGERERTYEKGGNDIQDC